MTPSRSCEIYIDGASRGNPGPAGIGVHFADGWDGAQGLSKYIGETTNNVAEYAALVYALQEAVLAGYTDVTIRTDSELLARQMVGRYRVRDQQLRLLHDFARHLSQRLRQFTIQHIPREKNQLADRLASHAARQHLG